MAFEYSDLKDFQKRALAELEDKFSSSSTESIFLHSCTGSGKTLIMSFFIKNIIESQRKTVFIWLTPGTGDLEIQSQIKFEKYIHNSDSKLLKDVMVTGFEENDVCFINWELVNREGNIALTDSEKKNLQEHIQNAHNEGLNFVLIIDEEHMNKTVKSANVINMFNPLKVIRASATPKGIGNSVVVEVKEQDVINDGLIKKVLFINEDIENNGVIENQSTFLLEKAIEKQQSLRQICIDNKIDVNPLILIQVPNESDELIYQIEEHLASMDITYENNKLAVWLANKKENLHNIEANDAEPIAIIIKQAVAVGWDCPRAYILVKLRENMDESFEIQTIGRIRRMPQALHYEIRELDSAYLYTFDQKFTEGVKSELGNRALESRILKLKAEFTQYSLPQEKKSSLDNVSNIRQTRLIIKKHFENKYSLSTVNENKGRLFKYDFSENITIKARQGDLITTDKGEIKELATISATELLNPLRHRNEYHRVVKKIAASLGLSYDDVSKIIRSLFSKESKYRGKILSLDTNELYAFVINNASELKEDFIEANSDFGLQEEFEMIDVITTDFKLPLDFTLTFDNSLKTVVPYIKNVYDGYYSNAAPRSDGERYFERFCEENSLVSGFFKNGDNGAGYFSLVYMDNFMKHRLFYPDYIVWANDQMYVFEVKGSQNTSGQSEDIDVFTKHKHASLKKYLSKNNLKGGIVRLNKSDLHLYVCVGEYTEKLDTDSWMELSKYLEAK